MLNAWRTAVVVIAGGVWACPGAGVLGGGELGVRGGEVDATTLEGKVLCGYQGWFNTPGDGTGFGFSHWGVGLEKAGGRFEVDLWPEVSELEAGDVCEVPGFVMEDGTGARVYSGYRKGPTMVHFRWMREYGIDGVFLSRFVCETGGGERTRHVNQVLANVREGARREGRVWALMLDLTMGKEGATTELVKRDWRYLCDVEKVREDGRYVHEKGRPVVMLWGLGFKDRPWTAEQGAELVEFFEHDPKYGGVYLIGGVDPSWRTLKGDSRTEEAWGAVYRSFDAVSPWDAGRYRDAAGMERHRREVWQKDLEELKGLGKGYVPTVFPGFSWDNLTRAKPGATEIGRRGGEFYWGQFAAMRELGVRTVFVGMFDEVNEGTAIYKTVPGPRGVRMVDAGEGGKRPGDWYLRLTGAGARMVRGEGPLERAMPGELSGPAGSR